MKFHMSNMLETELSILKYTEEYLIFSIENNKMITLKRENVLKRNKMNPH